MPRSGSPAWTCARPAQNSSSSDSGASSAARSYSGPGLAGAVGGHQLVGLARELVGARERAPAAAARSTGSRWSSTRRSKRACHGLALRPARRRAPPTGGRGRRRPRPPRRRAPPAAARRGRPRPPRSPPPSRPAPCRGPSCWPGRRRARRWRRPRTGCSRRRCGPRPGPPRRRSRPGGPRRARRRRAARPARRAAASPAARRSSPCGPWAGSTTDCVATAPMPGRAQMQSEPTENQCECTAAPCSPVAGSKATIEYVPWRTKARRYPGDPHREASSRASATPRRASSAPTATSPPARRASRAPCSPPATTPTCPGTASSAPTDRWPRASASAACSTPRACRSGATGWTCVRLACPEFKRVSTRGATVPMGIEWPARA